MINRLVYPLLTAAFRKQLSFSMVKSTQSLPLIRPPAVFGILGARSNSSGLSPPDEREPSVPEQSKPTEIFREHVKTSESEAVVTPEDVLPDKLYKTIDLELLAYEPAVLDSYEWFLLTAASHLGIEVGEVRTPRKSDKWRFPLLKSAHVHKKHKVHYEIRTYHKFITLKKLTGSTASTYLEYIQRNIPEGIGMKVSKLEVLPKPDYISPPSPHKTITPPS